MLFAAMSCYQGQTMSFALDKIKNLQVDGIQLTPGNIPDVEFQKNLNIPYRLHHTFDFNKKIGRIYDQSNEYSTNIRGTNHSIHPPKRSQLNVSFESWFEKIPHDTVLEVMYPIYHLSNDEEINMCLDRSQHIAVDISHLYICVTQKCISDSTLKRIMNYDKIEEIHFSHNNGKFDSHQPMNENTPFLSWGMERTNIPWIYESLLHKLSYDEAMYQLNLLR